MASILDRYGIKEVADVTFYKLEDDGSHNVPVLYLDTLKVSTIEQTAEQADARGGKGNPKLITWDYGKEITVTLEDALFSAKSMAIMFSDGTTSTEPTYNDVERVAVVRANSSSLPDYFTADIYDSTVGGAVRKKIQMGAQAVSGAVPFANAALTLVNVYDETGNPLNVTSTVTWAGASATSGKKYFVKYKYANKTTARVITISGDSFPGTYYVTGDTYARSDISGKDQFFQFVIPKAKMTSENTITLEAEGDPSTFSMNLTVLRPEDGEMMKLIQYDINAAS